jgi:hypothetical protein
VHGESTRSRGYTRCRKFEWGGACAIGNNRRPKGICGCQRDHALCALAEPQDDGTFESFGENPAAEADEPLLVKTLKLAPSTQLSGHV